MQFHLSIITPEHSFFDGDVDALIINAPDGEIGILPGHESMIVSLIEGEIRFKIDGKEKNAVASSGFATVMPDEVLILLQTCEWPEEIDIKRAQRDKHIAQERLRQQKNMQEYALAKSMLARAMARLRVTNHTNYNN